VCEGCWFGSVCVSTAAWHAKHVVCIAVSQPVESLHAAHITDAVCRACHAALGCRAIGSYAVNPWPVMKQHMLSTSIDFAFIWSLNPFYHI
jgi:hypothetical protein